MFSIYTLKSAKDAAKYYRKDNYYFKEGDNNEGFNTWHGKGARMSMGMHARSLKLYPVHLPFVGGIPYKLFYNTMCKSYR